MNAAWVWALGQKRCPSVHSWAKPSKEPRKSAQETQREAAAGRAFPRLDAIVNHTDFLAQFSLWLSQERFGIPDDSIFI